MSWMSVLAAAAVATGPITGGGLTGIVTDTDTGLPLPGAVVTLDDLGRGTVSDEDGWYRLSDVPPGPQHLSVEMLGYRSRSIHVLVPAGESLRVDLALEIHPVEVQAVVVRGHIPLRGIDGGESDLQPTRRMSRAAIRNDPFAAEPDVLEALVGGPVAKRPESGGGLHVRGGSSDQVGYLLDGFPVFSPYHAGTRSSAWSPTAVAEVELKEGPALATDALSGTIVATTVDPGDRVRSTGAFSVMQVQLGLEGPLPANAGFLLDVRFGYPGFVFHSLEPSYLRGEDHDVIAKLQKDFASGRLRILGFDNRNGLRFASVSTDVDEAAVGDPPRNDLRWRSGTLGLAWDSHPGTGARWNLRAWRADLEASARWMGIDPAYRDLESERVQLGVSGAVEWGERHRSTEVGARIGSDDIDYRVGALEEGAPAFRLREGLRSVGVYGRIRRRSAEGLELSAEIMGLVDDSGPHLLPHVQLLWPATDRLSLFARYTEGRQMAQSLRNGESIVGRLFPPELPVTAEQEVRIARARTAVAGFVGVPWNGGRITGEAYGRSIDGLALVAAGEGRPFATEDVPYGSATVRGAAVELSTSAARYGLLASYGVERVEFRAADVAFAPGYAARHRARIGGIVHPTATLSVRLAWVGEFGRRGTDTIGVVEWESCNLLDEGCEFAGSPEALGALGAGRLPAYHRLDLSVRKHWHVSLAGRDARLEAFVAGSNLLGRANVLNYTVNPETGEREPIEMRPAAPVAAGVEWSF